MSGRSHRLLGFNQYSRESICLAQGHNTVTLVGTKDLSIRSPTLYVASIFILHVLLHLVIKKTIIIYIALNIIKSMYENVKSKVKYKNRLSENFECYLGVRQGESLSPFLFSMYLNDIEDEFYLSRIEGIDIHHIKLFLLLYADDITLFSETAEGLQIALNLLSTYRI